MEGGGGAFYVGPTVGCCRRNQSNGNRDPGTKRKKSLESSESMMSRVESSMSRVESSMLLPKKNKDRTSHTYTTYDTLPISPMSKASGVVVPYSIRYT